MSRIDRDMEFMRDWCREVLSYVRSLARNRGEATTPFDEWIDVVEEQYANGSVRGLRSLLGDISELAGGLSHEDQRPLAELLETKFGSGAADFKIRL